MSNKYFDRLKARVKESTAVVDMADWVCANTTIKGKKFSVESPHGFQRAILNDMHPNLCVKKLSQMGLTEIQIRKGIAFMAQNPGTRVLMTFPDLNMAKQNSQTRIKPIFDYDFPCVKGSDEIRNSNLYQMGQSFMHVSANVESAATSTPVDFIINDEFDLSDPEFLSLVKSRIQHSSFKLKQGMSTPTFSGYGISLEYESSDQREYFYQCEHCNHWQIPQYDTKSIYIPDLPESVEDLIKDVDYNMANMLDYDNSYVRCVKCGKRIDIGDDSRREWVARYPERIHSRGYQVRPFSSNLLSIKYLVTTMADFARKDQLRRGVNTVLGMEYKDSNSRLEEADIKMCFESEAKLTVGVDTPCFLGCDMGQTCHITVSTGDYDVVGFWAVPVDDLEQTIEDIMKKYNIVCGAMDRYPFIPTANALRDKYAGVLFPVHYSDGRAAEPKKELDGSTDYYVINRTNALDYIQQAINNHRLRMYGYGDYKQIITAHLRDMYRDEVADGQPMWRKMNGNDHFFHSLGYSFVARKIKYVLDYAPLGEVDDRISLGIYGPSGEDKINLYNGNILRYSNDIRVKRIKRW